MNSENVIKFWFSELTPKDWYKKDDSLDEKIKSLFLETYVKAIRGELFSWRESIEGRLAEIIVLDQFSRNIFRNDARAFQFDPVALTLSQEASSMSESKKLSKDKQAFILMPYMHSESLVIHEEAERLFSELGQNLDYEIKHKRIIEKFGRYPNRNEVLGRVSTPDEIEFLKGPDSSF